MASEKEILFSHISQQLIIDEALKFKVYKDSEGKWTIGVGRNLEDKGITEGEAMFLLGNDIQEVFLDLQNFAPWFDLLTPARKAALMNVRFQLGEAGFRKFRHMIAAIEAGDWPLAGKELINSKLYQQAPGRTSRRAQQLITGDWTY